MRIDSFFAFFFGIFLLFSACDNRKEVEALQLQTETIHDNAMADLGDLMRTKTALRKAMAAMDSLETSTGMRDSIHAALTDMTKADEDMRQWMVNYKEPDKNMPKADALRYLQGQKAAIEKNAADILSATEAGKRCLANAAQ